MPDGLPAERTVRSPTRHLLQRFEALDALFSPPKKRAPDRTAQWHSAVNAIVDRSRADYSTSEATRDAVLGKVLDDPLFQATSTVDARREPTSTVDVSRTWPPAKKPSSPAGRLRSAFTGRGSSYLVKQQPPEPQARRRWQAMLPKSPGWAKSPKDSPLGRALRRIRRSGASPAAAASPAGDKKSRWAAAVASVKATAAEGSATDTSPSTDSSPAESAAPPRPRVSFLQRGQQPPASQPPVSHQPADALDSFMARGAPADGAADDAARDAPPAARRHNPTVAERCLARRREVMAEMGVAPEALHASMQPYGGGGPAVERRGDALDDFLAGAESRV